MDMSIDTHRLSLNRDVEGVTVSIAPDAEDHVWRKDSKSYISMIQTHPCKVISSIYTYVVTLLFVFDTLQMFRIDRFLRLFVASSHY